MSTAKHSPGPWKMNPATLSGFNFIQYTDLDDKTIFRVQFPGLDRSKAVATAAVIQAAPELLARLQKLVSLVGDTKAGLDIPAGLFDEFCDCFNYLNKKGFGS